MLKLKTLDAFFKIQDNQSLNKFLAYGKSADKGLDPKNIPGPSGDLAEVEISKQSDVELGNH